MATYYAMDILYGDRRLSSFGLMICSIDTSTGLETREVPPITFNTIKPVDSNKFHIMSSQYDTVLTTTFQIAKLDGSEIFPEELSKIKRWLCRTDNKYYRFKVIQEGYSQIYHEATISANELIFIGKCIGLELTVTTNRPFALVEPSKTIFTTTTNDEQCYFFDSSDETGNTIPNLTITCLLSSDLTISNSLTGTSMTVKNCVNGEVITIDGDNQLIISSVRSLSDLASAFNYEFLEIGNTYDNRKNILTVSMPCKIELIYSPSRKVAL